MTPGGVFDLTHAAQNHGVTPQSFLVTVSSHFPFEHSLSERTVGGKVEHEGKKPCCSFA